jgi:hypothetical protein
LIGGNQDTTSKKTTKKTTTSSRYKFKRDNYFPTSYHYHHFASLSLVLGGLWTGGRPENK